MSCALVTGASRGLGRAIAVQLSKDHGLHILVNYASNEAAAKETLAEIESAGGSGELLQFNVQTKSEVDEALNSWKEKNEEKSISVLVNNAGITRDGLFMWMPEKDWDDVLNISAKGLFNVTQNAIQQMLRKRSGRIVNIASVSGMKGVAGQTNYSAAKGAIISATKALAQEVAKRKITVNAVAPGFITSDMTKDLNEAELKQMIPMNRFGNPQEVAHLVSFLVSEKAGYITGEVININGGIYS
ncbi:3-oxoacyl-[acyl-carrier-protein] reductase FabG [Dyadobacter sp. CECT 9623]|uniref:3-oxoacyl-[acyl-carrier-protein] reductase FabG n=1 Tax=Dyadobacter linearis TaxID=2823330 RepID=A0ABM8UJV5_9BACT|nr:MULTISPECIES: 3-oxoacyl-ACP reductase FabG [unclassified Dyadobacter]MCE7062083.1 3-oxoacyl-ACP reductase FabG [Dyadobacter sp. CY343]CAG5067673.1 3-oxoacyl-[acyl-carrier-protein] reductase FabG [Dyadobacter sp. CECT 9623]